MNTPRVVPGSVVEPPDPSWRGQFARLIALATPIALSRLSLLFIVIEDIAFLGHVDSVALAHYGIANAVFMVLLLTGVGMSIGVAVLTSQNLGAGEGEAAATVFAVGLGHALVMGLGFVLISFAGERFYLAIGHAPALAHGSAGVLAMLSFGLPALLAFTVASLFLEALGRPRVGLVVMLLANLVNIAANAIAMEMDIDVAEGVALASTLVRYAMAAAMLGYLLVTAQRLAIGHVEVARFAEVSRKLRRIGYAMGLAQGLESMAFSSLTIVSGYLGAAAVATFQVVMQFMGFAFMGAVGVSTATAVEVGRAVGRGDGAGLRRAGWSGLAVIALYMGVVSVFVLFSADWLAGLLSGDPAVVALAAPALTLVAIMLIPDGAQGVLMGALRGTGDAWVPTVLHLFAFLGVMVPGARLLAIEAGFGVPGLIGGTFLGVSVATVVLALRFRVVTRREVRRL